MPLTDPQLIKQLLSSLASVTIEPALVLDKAGMIVDLNPALERDVGCRRDDLVRSRFLRFVEESDQPRFEILLQAVDPSSGTAASEFDVFLSTTLLRFLVQPYFVQNQHVGYLCQVTRSHTDERVRLHYLMENLDQGIWDFDVLAQTMQVSKTWRDMRGMAIGFDLNHPDHDWTERIHPDDKEALVSAFYAEAKGERTSLNTRYRYLHPDGHWIWIFCNSQVVEFDRDGVPARIVGTDTDVTYMHNEEDRVLQLQGKLQLALDASGIGVWEFDPNTESVHWDDRMLEIYGLEDGQNDRSGVTWEAFLHPDDLDATIAYAQHCQDHGISFHRDYRIMRPDGGVRHIRSRAEHVAFPGKLPKLIGVNIDVTEDYLRAEELENAKRQLEHDSKHDALTGLANRRLLDETTANLFAEVPPKQNYAVLHLDLDHFKQVNDTHGHAAGDFVLVEVANALRAVIGRDGLICRMGGDEFAILYEHAPSEQALYRICEDLVAAVQKPIIYQGHLCRVGVSIGCAFGQGPMNNHSEIFINADTALYEAKEAGRNCYRVWGKVAENLPQSNEAAQNWAAPTFAEINRS